MTNQPLNGNEGPALVASATPTNDENGHDDHAGTAPVAARKPKLFDLTRTRITEDTDVPPVEPTITIKNGVFAVKGDISFISGLPKSGKSTTCRYLMATALMPHIPDGFDTLDVRANYCDGRPIVYIDSEQPLAYTKRTGDEIRKILGTERLPDYLYLYNWRHHTAKENREAIEQLFDELPNAAYWIVDGITDFIAGANEEKESNEVIRFFMRQASNLNTTIVLLIHENAGGGKMRGHIGSEAERKCGGAITIRKDRQNGVHWIEPKLIRGSADFEPYPFMYDGDQHRFVLCDDGKAKNLRALQDKRVSRKAELEHVAGLVFADTDNLAKDDILKAMRMAVPPKPDQSTEAHRRHVLRLFNEMNDEYNLLTPFGEVRGRFRYLAPVETAPF